jgi:hypothetical protein
LSLTAAERETTFTRDDDEKLWHVSSYIRADITKLKKNPDFVVKEEGVFNGTPFVIGTLPVGGIAIRAKSAGTIKRGGPKRVGRPTGVKTCTGNKADGTPCGSIAGADGRCKRHPL